MAHKVSVCYAYLDVDDSASVTATKLRGYIGYLFVEDTEFHHHSENPYHYPLVQYKKVGQKLVIVGFNDYADIVCRKVATLDHILTPEGSKKIASMRLETESMELEKMLKAYKFETPWIALNAENHGKFLRHDPLSRKPFLERILIGNILSMLKGLGVRIDFNLEASVQDYVPVRTHAHGNEFVAFRGSFVVNLNIPLYAGLGKSVSKGFGTVSPLDSRNSHPR